MHLLPIRLRNKCILECSRNAFLVLEMTIRMHLLTNSSWQPMHFKYSLNTHKIHLWCIWMQKKCSPTMTLNSNFFQRHRDEKIKNSQKFSKCHQKFSKCHQKFSKCVSKVLKSLEKIKISQNFSKILKKFSKVLKCISKMSQKCNSTMFFHHGNHVKLNVTSRLKDMQSTISFCSKKSKVLKSSQKKIWSSCSVRASARTRACTDVCKRTLRNNISYECGSSRHE